MVKALNALVLFILSVAVFSYPTPNEVIIDDMIFDKEFYDGLVSGKNAWEERAWPTTDIPIFIDPSYSYDQYWHILDALMMIEDVGCITFWQYDPTEHTDWIHIRPNEVGAGALCVAQVGHVGGYQYINVPVNPGRDCFDYPGRVAHEMLHSLAYRHMQNTPGRDNYIRINWENVASASSWNIYTNVGLLGTRYDYESVMHYSPWQGSNGNGPAFTPIQTVPPGVEIGQRAHLSQGDYDRLHNLYCAGGRKSESHPGWKRFPRRQQAN